MFKDYSLRNEKIKLIHALATSIGEHMTELFENGYDQGYADGKADTPFTDTEEAEKRAYEDGMNAAWEVARKLVHPRLGGYTEEQKQRIFGEYVSSDSILQNYTASEAIAKIKEYEDKQKCKECKRAKDPIFYGYCVGECDYEKQTEDEIKVGYEVYNLDRENKRIVTAIDGNKAIQLCSNGKYTIDNIDTLHWTGRVDLRMKKVLEGITYDG